MQAKTKNQQYNIHFQNKTRDGSLQTEKGRTPQQIYIYHPYILCHFCILLTHARHRHAPPPLEKFLNETLLINSLVGLEARLVHWQKNGH